MTASTCRRYASTINVFSREATIQKLDEARKATVARLRDLADRLEQLSMPNSCEVMVRIQPHVEKLLLESQLILGAVGAKT